ncbi:hypothetical protein AB0M46_17680 [Dactylosporangium sp. NPDC051485]
MTIRTAGPMCEPVPEDLVPFVDGTFARGPAAPTEFGEAAG